MWLANREIRHYTALPICNGHTKKYYWNQVKILFPPPLAISRVFSISFRIIITKSSVSFTLWLTDLICLFIYCLVKAVSRLIIVHCGSFLISFNCQNFDTFKLYSESIAMVCHESILIKKCFCIAKTWRSVVRLVFNKWMDAFIRVMIASSIQGNSSISINSDPWSRYFCTWKTFLLNLMCLFFIQKALLPLACDYSGGVLSVSTSILLVTLILHCVQSSLSF